MNYKIQDDTFMLEEHFLYVGRVITVIDYFNGFPHLRQIVRMGIPEWGHENSVVNNIIKLEGD